MREEAAPPTTSIPLSVLGWLAKLASGRPRRVIAIGVLVDATIVRALLVPSLMQLLDRCAPCTCAWGSARANKQTDTTSTMG